MKKYKPIPTNVKKCVKLFLSKSNHQVSNQDLQDTIDHYVWFLNNGITDDPKNGINRMLPYPKAIDLYEVIHWCGKKIGRVVCKICFLADYIGNRDLDDDYHKGFTIGRGKKMYFMMIWHGSSGNVTVYNSEDGNDLKKRYVSGDSLITVHFHENLV